MSLEDRALLPKTETRLNANRVTGITDAEGNFSFVIYSKKLTGVNFSFSITQENTEIKFLNDLVLFFDCGQVYVGDEGKGRFYVNNRKDIENKIIPFFNLNKLQTIKQYSFLRFTKALNICKINKPLLPNHIEELRMLLSDNTGKRPNK
jgi:hypothetical protein